MEHEDKLSFIYIKTRTKYPEWRNEYINSISTLMSTYKNGFNHALD